MRQSATGPSRLTQEKKSRSDGGRQDEPSCEAGAAASQPSRHVVPRELVVCEANETTCTSADWKECRWRRKMTPDRSSRPLNDRGLKL